MIYRNNQKEHSVYGMISITELARQTDWTVTKLEQIAKTKPKLFDLLIRGAVSKKLEDQEEMPF